MNKHIPDGTHAILHRSCGEMAFLYREEPVKGTRIRRELVMHLDGTPYGPFGTLCRCGSCGGVLRGSMDLAPGGPVLREYDMSNTEDMREIYAGFNDAEAIA